MTEQKLKRCKDFLKHFGVRMDDKFVYIHDGDTSIIMNPKTEWKEFLGFSIIDVAKLVARELELKIKRAD